MNTRLRVSSFIKVLCLISLAACTSSANRTYFDEADLASFLTRTEDLPPGWSTDGPRKPGIEAYRSPDSIGIGFLRTLEDGETIAYAQYVYRFPSLGLARQDYSSAVDRYTVRGYTPSGWVPEKNHADESKLGCLKFPNVALPACTWIARYGPLVTDVHFTLTPQEMDLVQLERLITIIDSRFSAAGISG